MAKLFSQLKVGDVIYKNYGDSWGSQEQYYHIERFVISNITKSDDCLVLYVEGRFKIVIPDDCVQKSSYFVYFTEESECRENLRSIARRKINELEDDIIRKKMTLNKYNREFDKLSRF